MGSAFLGADVVREGQDVFLVARIVLHGEFNHDLIGFAGTLHNAVNAAFPGIEILNELP